MGIRRILLTVSAIAGSLLLCSSGKVPADGTVSAAAESTARDLHKTLYETTGMEGEVSYAAFDEALTGYERIDSRKKEILVFVDFSKPSTQERLYVIDMKNRRLLYKSLVAHGRGSGDTYATSFSNTPGSHQSSLGFYLTLNTYQGRNGYSLRLDGLEPGINDKAYERAIVIHGPDYCTKAFLDTAGRLGRSFGCPSLPKEISDKIIDTIKEGAVLFIYADDKEYRLNSPILSDSETFAMQ